MANVKKFSAMQAIGHLCKHYERSVEPGHYGNPDIDQDKLYLDNVNLAPDRGKQTDYINEKIDEIMAGKTLRKDAVRMCCWVVDKPKNLPTKKEMEFFKETYDFLIERYGKKVAWVKMSASVHTFIILRQLITFILHFFQSLTETGKKPSVRRK